MSNAAREIGEIASIRLKIEALLSYELLAAGIRERGQKKKWIFSSYRGKKTIFPLWDYLRRYFCGLLINYLCEKRADSTNELVAPL